MKRILHFLITAMAAATVLGEVANEASEEIAVPQNEQVR